MERKWLRGMLLGVSLALLLAGGVALADAGGVLNSSWASQGVVLDGQIGPDEWDDATSVDITCVGTQAVTLYVKNDGNYLYLGADDPNDAADDDTELDIRFDDEPAGAHDHAWTYAACPSGEGGFAAMSPGQCGGPSGCTGFLGIAAGATYCLVVEPAPGVSGDVSWASGHAQYEMRIDLAASALQASPGQTIGAWLLVADNGTPGLAIGEWPCGLIAANTYDDPAEYGNLVLAEGPEFVPEPGTIALLGSGLAGLAGYAALRWRARS